MKTVLITIKTTQHPSVLMRHGYQTIQILSWSVITNLHSFPQALSTVSGVSDCEL